MANFSINNTEVLDTVNYIISGTPSLGQAQTGVGLGNPVYLTNNIPPYVQDPALGIPSPPPALDTFIKTDCFAVVRIDTPDQKVAVGGQMRCYISYDVTSVPTPQPAVLRIYVGIVRFSGTDTSDPNSGTQLATTVITLSNFTTGPETDDFIGNQIIVSYIDQPALTDKTGVYTYWLMIYVEDLAGTHDIIDISADVRNLIATKIAS